MKNITKALLGCFCVTLYACTPTQEITQTTNELKLTSIDHKEIRIVKQGIFQKPLVADLEVAKQREFFTRTYEAMDAEASKDNINGEFSIEKNCDIIVQPLYETNTTITDEKQVTTVTISGYPAYYKNIRTFEPKDTQAFMIYNYIGGYKQEEKEVKSKPVVVSDQTMENTVKEIPKKSKTLLGLSSDISLPKDELKDFYKTGLGASLLLLTPIYKNSIFYTMNMTYLRFGGKEVDSGFGNVALPSFNVVNANLGLRYKTSFNIYLESRLGYISRFVDSENTGDVNATIALGLNYKKLDIGIRREFVFDDSEGQSNFTAFRLGFYF
jgi:hypothetical protein